MNIGEIKFRYYNDFDDPEYPHFVFSHNKHTGNARQLSSFFREVSDFGRGEIEVEMATGCYDTNGNLIYEGDIVFTEAGIADNYTVVFEDGQFYLDCYGSFLDIGSTDCKIVGNIHEGVWDDS